jgi:hypothetical protein
LETQSSAGFTLAANPAYLAPQGEPGGEREQGQQKQPLRNLRRIDSNPREQERQDQRQVPDRADRQKHYDANGEGQIALGKLGQLWQERRARRRAKQQQTYAQWLVEREQFVQRDGRERHHDKNGQQRK